MPASPSSGWYPDPERPRTWRYWDGRQWTAHRAPVAPAAAPTRRGIGTLGTVLIALAAVLGTAMVGTVALALAVAPSSSSIDAGSSPASAAGSAATSSATRATAGAVATPVVPPPPATPTATRTPFAPAPVPRASTPSAAPKKAPAAAAGLVAVSGVVDGDTIKVRLNGATERVRVIGIDTPELASRECFAQQAASKMQSLVQSKQVRLVADPTQDNRDRYGRLLRHVHLADGRSVAQILIAGGFGREYTYDRAYAGQAAHLKAQRAAQAADRGIWSSGCATAVAPAPVAPAPSQPAGGSGACTIKGNISSEGEKIYHVPGGAFYEQTKISTAKGERWFCSEADAVNAGWRASQR